MNKTTPNSICLCHWTFFLLLCALTVITFGIKSKKEEQISSVFFLVVDRFFDGRFDETKRKSGPSDISVPNAGRYTSRSRREHSEISTSEIWMMT